jgi:DNA-binding transcriptional LysR family regulator
MNDHGMRAAAFVARCSGAARCAMPGIGTIVHLVAAGFGVSVVPQSIEQIRADGVAYVKVKGEVPRAPIAIAFRKDTRSASVRNFVAVERRHAPSSS